MDISILIKNSFNYLLTCGLVIILGIGSYRFLKNNHQSATSTELPNWYWKNNPAWTIQTEIYKNQKTNSQAILFLGTSLTRGMDWAEFLNNPHILNRGIGGDQVEGALARINDYLQTPPKCIFIEFGTNDLGLGLEMNTILSQYKQLLEHIQKSSKSTQIYIYGPPPIASTKQNPLDSNALHFRNSKVWKLSQNLENLAKQMNITFIPLGQVLANQFGNRDSLTTYDGTHLNFYGYQKWKNLLIPFLNQCAKE